MKQNLFLDGNIDKIENKYKIDETKNTTFKTTHYIVANENKKCIKRDVGDYFVIRFSYEKLLTKQNILIKEVERVIKSFLKKYNKSKKVLVVGLGNKSVLADSLGIFTTDKLIATNQYTDFLTIPKIALFNPSVTDKTGINSFKLIEMVVEDIHPDIIIMVDSLATKDEECLNSAIEINNTGIIPGSALGDAKEIKETTFNIPILSIGIPCCLKYNKKLYTSTSIYEVINEGAFIISSAINNIFIKHQ